MKIQFFNNNRFLRSVIGLFLVFILSGCGSSRYTVLVPATEPLKNFEVLEIRSFTSNLTDEDSVELANRFADQLHQAVMDERKRNPGESIFRDVVRSTERDDSVLVLDGVVISFEKGSRAARYFIGFGAGKATAQFRQRFRTRRPVQWY